MRLAILTRPRYTIIYAAGAGASFELAEASRRGRSLDRPRREAHNEGVRSLLLLAAVAALAGSCSQESCPCPSGFATIMLPPALAGMVPCVTADSCTALATSPPGSYVMFMATKNTTCHVRLDFPSGATVTSTIVFRSLGGCYSDTYSGAATMTSVDGAATD